MRTEIGQSESSAKLGRLLSLQAIDPQNQALRRQCVDLAASLGKFDVVIGLAEAALAADAADALAGFDLATGRIGQRNYRAALDILEELERQVGRDMAVRMNRALCHYCLGEYASALPLLQDCYGAGMRNASALRLLVSTLHHLGELDEALKMVGSNVEPAQGDGPLAGVYALLYLDCGDSLNAARWAKVALAANPRSIDGRITQATLDTERMQLDAARGMLQGVIDDAPDNGRAWVGMGALSMLANDLAAAKQQLARGVELMPGHVGSWHVLAWAQLMSGELGEAQRNFEAALEADRNFAESHGGLAVVAAMRGERERAQHLIAVALRLDPASLSAKFAAALLAGHADPARAQSIIRDTVQGLGSASGSALSQLLTKMTRH